MTEEIKHALDLFIREKLGLPAWGIAPVHDFQGQELASMQALTDYIKTVPGASPELQRLIHPREMLGGLKSIIILAVPNYMTGPQTFEQSRSGLRGAMSATHLSAALQKRMADVQDAITGFFKDQGLACRPLAPNAPLKIFAARCGIGFYGKSSMIINKEQGSWISLSGYATDAVLEADSPVEGSCKECTLCIRSCPANALDQPYSCITQNCINFQLQSKNVIPENKRHILKNGLAYGACRICRDVCPYNKDLTPLNDPELSAETLNPDLLAMLDIDDEQWQREFAATRMGAIMQNRRYVIRNALIALTNFKDARAVEKIAEKLESDDALVREHAAWALGKIGGSLAQACLKEALRHETTEEVRSAIQAALKENQG